MSRKYLNDKYCVRCGRTEACPYLRKNYDLLLKDREFEVDNVLDIGCGNGRNSEFMKEKGYNVVSLDMVNDYGVKTILGKDKLPVKDGSIDVILCNYLMMFLNQRERKQLVEEIQRVAAPECTIMLELYPAKDCYAKTDEEMVKMQKQIFNKFKDSEWEKIRYSKGKFIIRKKMSIFHMNEIKWEKQNALIDAIILAYDKKIQYDYCIPEPYRVAKAVRKALYGLSGSLNAPKTKPLNLPKEFKEVIGELVSGCKDEQCRIESYMHNYSHRFGSEFFVGYGSLYRWREGEKEKAEKRVQKYISKEDLKLFKKIQDAIKIKKDIKAFEMEKVMGVY